VTFKADADEWLRRIDFRLQSHFRISRAVHANDPDSPGEGVPSASDWSRSRHRLTAPFGAAGDRYESDESYRRYLSSIHESKILAVLSLMERFDFGRHERIVELGCGDMPQAYTICAKFPRIAYTATDFDPLVIEQCSRLPLLQGIGKAVLDVTGPDLASLENHDLIVSWSLEFGLDDGQLRRLFLASKELGVPYLLCTHTAIGPLAVLKLPSAPDSRRGGNVRPRRLGWLRSTAEIARLANEAGMRLDWKAWHVNHAALYFTPA